MKPRYGKNDKIYELSDEILNVKSIYEFVKDFDDG